RFGLDARAVGGVREVRRDARGDAPASPDQPGLPEPRRIDGQPDRLDRAADRLDAREAALAELDDAGLDRQIAVEIAEPADANAARFEVVEPWREGLLGGDRERHARVPARLHVE